ncbi:hypothetical protein AB0G60_02415 [Streptomyces angustmyceticus]|uniref:Uncharacterized protein n=1 Tax=Streptomyces angustmyceticus TaxID=285578 RepID=A0A5J4LD00_9ACTN|nr:hypothetical protein [Streptomyces angustmyceticus]UAL65516.1 hypothetical protein K7396_02390 [Streptomyces angustmyceticus]GES27965.1 hypothetical protein San01_04520 [Streptomyces angustmyceticus]
MSSPRGTVARVAEIDLMSPADLAELTAAVDRGDAETIRSIGHHWSGLIALDIFSVADAIDPEK